ncbi:hypothetical protein FB563_1966 [Streptomyces puniciscabiei]|uniref:Uncharacterized protein n=1 Tax=Streptomyces puniciscabiei TaxID=164348 RepID=A0A542UD45_9ACTN|nr:hypothetical protein [Streptomyces puniciscabiei]TQK97010.1 hypothetical protein FB563_1966 [Streptomyces puniciscabiei]
MRLDWHAAEDHKTTMLRWSGDADVTSCSDLLDDFLTKINSMENEYRRTMAALYRAS